MQLFFELNRSCNMACSHCLRGDAQRRTMPDHVMQKTFELFGDEAASLGIGGGEPLLSSRVLKRFLQQLIWSGTGGNYDWIWIVTNGITLQKEYEKHLDTFEMGNIHHTLKMLSWQVPVSLAVSTDNYHDYDNVTGDPKNRYSAVEDLMGWHEEITVQEHGPKDGNLITMGRGSGKDLEINVDDKDFDGELIYVDVNGYIWPTCDLSYDFMNRHTKTKLCLGNVLKDSYEDFDVRKQQLIHFINKLEGKTLHITEGGVYEFEYE